MSLYDSHKPRFSSKDDHCWWGQNCWPINTDILLNVSNSKFRLRVFTACVSKLPNNLVNKYHSFATCPATTVLGHVMWISLAQFFSVCMIFNGFAYLVKVFFLLFMWVFLLFSDVIHHLCTNLIYEVIEEIPIYFSGIGCVSVECNLPYRWKHFKIYWFRLICTTAI